MKIDPRILLVHFEALSNINPLGQVRGCHSL